MKRERDTTARTFRYIGAICISALFFFIRGAASVTPKDTMMADNDQVTVTRLGTVVPGVTKDSSAPRDEYITSQTQISGKPMVLWSRKGPPAVLYEWYSIRGAPFVGGTIKQNIEVLSKGSFKIGGFGSVFPIKKSDVETEKHRVEALYRAIPADIDGDGNDEVILLYGCCSEGPGNIEVYSPRKRLARWKGSGSGYSHMPVSMQVARIGGKDVFHIVMRRFDHDHSSHEKYVILRVDEKGITKIRLRDVGFDIESVLGVGAVTRPGSNKLDEIIAVVTNKKEPQYYSNAIYYFSCHTPDGKILAAPRRGEGDRYSSSSFGLNLYFIPGNDTIIAFNSYDRHLYLANPQKPGNWFNQFNLDNTCTNGRPNFIGVIDPEHEPKIIYACGEQLYARDLHGRFLIRSKTGWNITGRPTPFFRAAPPEQQQELNDILVSRDGSVLLLVHSRFHVIKELSKTEIQSAARRFLSEKTLKEIQDKCALRFPTDKFRLDDLDKKRRKLGIARPIRNLTDWKALMPKDYEKACKDAERSRIIDLEMELTRPLHDDEEISPESYRDIAAYQRWLADINLPALTTFTVLRDGVMTSRATIRGAPLMYRWDMNDPPHGNKAIQWRPVGDGAYVILSLDDGVKEENPIYPINKLPQGPVRERGFYLIEWGSGSHDRK